jgi:LmbE family N-acetylglucosaminyl deacetylase
MIGIQLDQVRQILCLGAHSDDIEIGCGGTLLDLLAKRPDTRVHWVVLSARGPREAEARASAERFLAGAGEREIILGQFRDGYLPFEGSEVKDFFEGLKELGSPDLIFTHYRHDLHQDHRMVCDLAWNTFRNHLILEYEIPKYDGDMGAPNLFAPLSREICDEKIAVILESFGSQADRYWFTDDTFRSLLRLRGVEARSQTGFAEAFYARKTTVDWAGKLGESKSGKEETKQ